MVTVTAKVTKEWELLQLSTGNKSEEFPQVIQFWWLALKNFPGISREQVLVNDSPEILEKFPGISSQF